MSKQPWSFIFTATPLPFYGDIDLLLKVIDVFQETTLHLKQHMYKCLILCDAPQQFNLKCHYYNLKVFKVGDIHLVSNGGHSCSNIHLTFCIHQDICNLSAAGSCEVRLGKRSSYYADKTPDIDSVNPSAAGG